MTAAGMADTLARALGDDPFYARIFAAAHPGSAPAYFGAALTEARAAGWVDQAGSPATGAAIWIDRTDAQAARTRQDAIRDRMGKAALSAYRQLLHSMKTVCGPHLPTDAVYLSILGGAPQAQGAGTGGALVARGLTRVDGLGRPASLETFNRRSVPFYERHGFAVAAEVTEPLTGCPVWVMVRPRHPV